MLVMAFMAVSFLIISGVLYSSSNAALQAGRNQQYYEAQQAAIAAAERAVAGMVRDVRATGGSGGLSNYEILPDPTENPGWADYEFDIQVTSLAQNTVSELIWKYQGLAVTNDLFRVRAGARTLNLETPIASVVEQDLQVAEIPLFSFMVYSEFDLSFITPPWNDIGLNGRVHSNREMYCFPSGALVFSNHVTAAGEIHLEQHPADASPRVAGTVGYLGEGDSQANRLQLAPGAGDPYVVLETLASQADLTVVISDGAVMMHDGISTNGYWTNFISTNVTFSFYDNRELRTVHGKDIDMSGFFASYAMLGSPKLICLQDISNYGPETVSAFRLVHASQLPAAISLVTTNALYVKGDYNTVGTVPSMLAANAVTLVSTNWSDSFAGIGSAASTTYNLALLTGTVPSDAGAGVFDGGVFNALRLLEFWDGQTLTFNGAVATPFVSRHVVDPEPWRGTAPQFYSAPTTRIFNYDTSFLTPAGLPRGTPMLYTLVRSEMVMLPPDTLF
jgi:hypothetical protein